MKRTDRRLVAVLLCLLVAAGCGALTEVMNLSKRINDLGYSNVSVNHNTTNGFDTVSITAAGGPEGGNGEDIARMVWDTYPAEVDKVVLTLNGEEYSGTAAELEKAFGPRKIQPDPDNSFGKSALWWIIGIGVFVLLAIVGVIILVVVLIKKGRRRQSMPQHPYQPYPPNQPQPPNQPYLQYPPQYPQQPPHPPQQYPPHKP